MNKLLYNYRNIEPENFKSKLFRIMKQFTDTNFSLITLIILDVISYFQILSCIVESNKTLYNNSNIKGNSYFYNFMLAFNLNSISPTNNNLIFFYLTVELFLLGALLFFILLSGNTKLMKNIKPIIKFEKGLLKTMTLALVLFEKILTIPIFNGFINYLFCTENTYIYLSGECVPHSEYSSSVIMILTLYGIVFLIAFILKYYLVSLINNPIIFNVNCEYSTNYSEKKSLKLFTELAIVFILNSKIFNNYSSNYLILIIGISLFSAEYMYPTSSVFLVFQVKLFLKMLIILLSLGNIIGNYLTMNYISLFYLFITFVIYIFSIKISKYKFFKMFFKQTVSSISNENDLLLFARELFVKIRTIDNKTSDKSELQGYIEMMNDELLFAQQFKDNKLHYPIYNEWDDKTKIETSDRVYMANFLAFLLEFYHTQRGINGFNLSINLSYYFLEYIENISKATYYLIKASEEIGSIQQELTYFKIKTLIKEKLLAKTVKDNKPIFEIYQLDLTNYFKYEVLELQFIEELEYFITQIHFLWKNIIKDSNEKKYEMFNRSKASFKNLQIKKEVSKESRLFNVNMSKGIYITHKNLINIYKMMIEINYSWTTLWNIYENIINSIEYDLSITQMLNNHILEFKLRKKHELGKTPLTYIFSDRSSVIIIINGMPEKLGLINYASSEVVKVFGYKSSELFNKPIETLMPDIIANRHPLYMKQFFRTGEKTLIDRTTTSFGLNKNQHILECAISVKQIPYFKELQFCGIVQQKSKVSNFVLLDEDFNIKNISTSLANLLDLNENLFAYEDIPIFMISRQLFKLCIAEYEKQQRNIVDQEQIKRENDENNFRKKKNKTEKKLQKDEFNIELFKNSVEKLFDKNAMNLNINIHSLLRSGKNVQINKKQSNNLNSSKDQIFNKNSNLYNDLNNQANGNKKDNKICMLSAKFKSILNIFNSNFSAGKISNILDLYDELFSSELDIKYGKNINEAKKKKGDTMHFKLEGKLSYYKHMDGYKIFFISFSEDTNYFDNTFLEKTYSSIEDNTIKPKIDLNFNYVSRIDDINIGKLKYSEMKNNKELIQNLFDIEENSQIFKNDFDISLYNANSETHSSSSQVVNKQIKYNRLITKKENLHYRNLEEIKYSIYIIFNNLITVVGLVLSIIFYNFSLISHINSNESILGYLLGFYNSLNLTHLFFLELKIAFDQEIKNMHSAILSGDSLYSITAERSSFWIKYGFANSHEYFDYVKNELNTERDKTLEYLQLYQDSIITSTDDRIKSIIRTKLFTGYINNLTLIDSILSVDNFNIDKSCLDAYSPKSKYNYTSYYYSQDKDFNYIKQYEESIYLKSLGLVNQINYIQNVVNDNKFTLNIVNDIRDMINEILFRNQLLNNSNTTEFSNTKYHGLSGYSLTKTYNDLNKFLNLVNLNHINIINYSKDKLLFTVYEQVQLILFTENFVSDFIKFILIILLMFLLGKMIKYIYWFYLIFSTQEKADSRTSLLRKTEPSTIEEIKLNLFKTISSISLYNQSKQFLDGESTNTNINQTIQDNISIRKSANNSKFNGKSNQQSNFQKVMQMNSVGSIFKNSNNRKSYSYEKLIEAEDKFLSFKPRICNQGKINIFNQLLNINLIAFSINLIIIFILAITTLGLINKLKAFNLFNEIVINDGMELNYYLVDILKNEMPFANLSYTYKLDTETLFNSTYFEGLNSTSELFDLIDDSYYNIIKNYKTVNSNKDEINNGDQYLSISDTLTLKRPKFHNNDLEFFKFNTIEDIFGKDFVNSIYYNDNICSILFNMTYYENTHTLLTVIDAELKHIIEEENNNLKAFYSNNSIADYKIVNNSMYYTDYAKYAGIQGLLDLLRSINDEVSNLVIDMIVDDHSYFFKDVIKDIMKNYTPILTNLAEEIETLLKNDKTTEEDIQKLMDNILVNSSETNMTKFEINVKSKLSINDYQICDFYSNFYNFDNLHSLRNSFLNIIKFMVNNKITYNERYYIEAKNILNVIFKDYYKWWLDAVFNIKSKDFLDNYKNGMIYFIVFYCISMFLFGVFLILKSSQMASKWIIYINNFLNMIPFKNFKDMEKVERYLTTLENS